MIVCDWVNMTYSRKVRLPFILFCFLRLRHGRYRLFLYWHLVAAALLCAPQFCLFSTSCVVFFPFAFCCKCCTHCDLGKKKQTLCLHWDSLGHMLANSFTSCVCSFVFRQFYKGETNMSLLSIICCSHLPNMMTIILWYICNIFMYFSFILLFLLQLL